MPYEYQIGHLNGCTVAILADGKVLPQQVVTDGIVSLTESYAKVTIGLPFYSDIELLNIDQPLRSGTMQGVKVKIGSVTFRLEQTRGGWVGPDEDNIYEAFPDAILAKQPDITDLDMFSGDIRMPLGAGYEDGGRIFLRQVDPLPITVNAAVPEFLSGGPSGV